MKITELSWLEEVVTKIETKHRITPEEVEEAFDRHPKIKKMRRGRFRSEHVYRALGQTEAGRYLTVFFIYKRTGKALAPARWIRRSDEAMPKAKQKLTRRRDPLPENFNSLEEFWNFWDTHSTADYKDLVEEADVRVDIRSSKVYCAVAKDLITQLRVEAQRQGVSTTTLIHLWLAERLGPQRKRSSA